MANEKKYLKNRDVFRTPDETFRFKPAGEQRLKNRPVVIGMGPAGLFAGLLLAEYGYKPIIIERGSAIEKRSKDVDHFWKTGELDPKATFSLEWVELVLSVMAS